MVEDTKENKLRESKRIKGRDNPLRILRFDVLDLNLILDVSEFLCVETSRDK